MARRPGQTPPSRPKRMRGAQHQRKQPAHAKKVASVSGAQSRDLVVRDSPGQAPPPEPLDEDDARGPDPLGDFLNNRSGVHEDLGEPIPDELLRNGAIGAGLVIAAAALFAILPDPVSMRESAFLLFGDFAADLTQAGKGLAGALFAIGLLLLIADGLLAAIKPRLPVEAHYAYAGQLGLGVCAVAPAALVVGILIGTVVFWICAIACALWVLGWFVE